MTLKDKYKDYFYIGAAISAKNSLNTCKDIILREFNSITCENEMKYSELTADGINYDFDEADKIYNFAMENDINMRFHTLMWHNQSPSAIFENTDRDKLLATFEKHVETVSKRYNNVYSCDVVNEAIDDKGDNMLRESPWLSIIGDDFIPQAFKIAEKAFPNVDLCYNDYNECDPVKSKKIYKLIKNLKAEGIPITSLGMQAHHNLYSPTMDEIKRAFELYAELDVKLHITELDISLFAFEDHSSIPKPTKELSDKQVKMYKEIFAIYREYKDIIESVTFWGVVDNESWLNGFPARNRKNWPLLFDENKQPKEAYYEIMNF